MIHYNYKSGTQYILCLDPGQTTGIALFQVSHRPEDIFLGSEEIEFDRMPETLWAYLGSTRHWIVVCEMIRVPNASFNPIGLRVIGMLDMLSHMIHMTIKFQYPSQLKGVRSRNPLKGFGEHEKDAIHHGLAYLESKKITVTLKEGQCQS